MITALLALAVLQGVHGHIGAWTPGMYCKNGLSTTDMPNAQYPVDPLWNLTTSDWFMHGACRSYPPPAGEYLSIPANGKFTVELAGNRGVTTLSYGGKKATAWPDGKVHPANWSTNVTDPNFPPSSSGCLGSPNLHAHGQVDAAGTAFAISYKGAGNINAVSLADFTVFSVLPNTPYQRLATYSVPNLPACPSGGCLCAWGWVPNHCGESNMYMLAYRCQVTGAKSTAKAVGAPNAPVWCESNPSACIKGPKQLLAVFQATGNNIVLPSGFQKDGQWPSPGYNSKVGFTAGAQIDIFATTTAASASGTTAAASVTPLSAVVASTVTDDGPISTGTLVAIPTADTGSATRGVGLYSMSSTLFLSTMSIIAIMRFNVL